jgi:predicted amidohydrolase
METSFKDVFNVGIVQPVIDPDISWNMPLDRTMKGKGVPSFRINIDPILAEKVWNEVIEGIASLIRIDRKPDLILIPELHVPPGRLSELKRISKRHGIMIIAGLDFERNPADRLKIRNRGAFIIPGNLSGEYTNRQTTLHFGKTYFTYMERSMFKNIEGEVCFEDQEQNMYIFQTTSFGNFGVMICSDIFDIERMILYQGRIHHLFIISLNKDLNTYFAMAESLTRLLYCNVVICNTGQYGGSLAISPFENPNDRTIYKYQGQRSLTSHQVSLPVSPLEKAQKFDFVSGNKKTSDIKFKASPPGYKQHPPSTIAPDAS